MMELCHVIVHWEHLAAVYSTDAMIMFQVLSLREKNLPISRIDRLNSLVEFKRCVCFLTAPLTQYAE